MDTSAFGSTSESTSGSTFVGRNEALHALEVASEQARTRLPQVVVVSGEAGIGKTALLTRFRDRLEDSIVLAAWGDDLETSLEFGLLDQMIGSSTPCGQTWGDPYAAGLGLLQYLGQLRSDRLCAVVVDDAHLADLPSLAALNFMIRRLHTDPVMLVLGTRPEGAARLPAGLVHSTQTTVTRLSLGGLCTDEVQALTAARGGQPLSHRAAERLRIHTGGSPLHLCALLDEVPSATLETMDQPLPAPRSFALLVVRDVAALSPSAQRLVSAAAVLGDRVQTAQLLDVADLDSNHAPHLLEELHERGLMLLPAGSDHVRFRHPLIRAAIYEDLGPGTRMELHRRAARVLPRSDRLQHRLAAALGPDAVLAADLEEEAGEQAARGHLKVAADSWLAAAQLSSAPEQAGRRRLHGIGLLLAAGDVAAALTHAEHVDAMPETGTRLYVQARMAWLTGHADAAAELGRRAWHRLSDLGPGEGDQLTAMLAQIDVVRDRGPEAVRWAAASLQGDIDPAYAHQTRALRAQALMTSGQGRDGLAELADLPADPGAVDVARHPELAARGMLRTALGQLETGERDLAAAASLAHGDLSPFRLTARACLATARTRLGQWSSAQIVAEEVVHLAADMEQHWLAAYLHATAALVPAGRGDWGTARGHVDAATAAAARLSDPASSHYATDAAMFLAHCHGDPAQVVRTAATLRDPRHTTPREPGMLTWPIHLVAALIELRRLDDAERELVRIEELAHARRHPSRLAAAARLRGQLADAHRDHTAARTAFEHALELGDASVEGVDADERAAAHLAYAAFLRRRGERRAAIEQAGQARDHYAALGATPFLQHAHELLAVCGVCVRSSDAIRPWADLLTPRERAVATIVASGRTNHQAAAELVVSVKTVGFHLENVYTKLHVHSRTELAARLAELRPITTAVGSMS